MRRLFRRDTHPMDDETVPDALSDPAGDARPDELDEFEPFVPVRGSYESYDSYEPDLDPAVVATATAFPAPDEAPRPRRAPRVPLPHVALPDWSGAFGIRWDLLLWVVILVLTGIVGTLLVRGKVSSAVETWWPVVVIAFAAAWMLIALLRRHVTSFLGATALAGVGLSLIMDARDIARFEETLLGVVLVTIGLGIVVRGLLLRQRSPL